MKKKLFTLLLALFLLLFSQNIQATDSSTIRNKTKNIIIDQFSFFRDQVAELINQAPPVSKRSALLFFCFCFTQWLKGLNNNPESLRIFCGFK